MTDFVSFIWLSENPESIQSAVSTTY